MTAIGIIVFSHVIATSLPSLFPIYCFATDFYLKATLQSLGAAIPKILP